MRRRNRKTLQYSVIIRLRVRFSLPLLICMGMQTYVKLEKNLHSSIIFRFMLSYVGAGSRGQENHVPSTPWNICAPLEFGSNYKHLNKIFAKMLHLSTETYNNEQVSKVFR